MCSLSVRFGGGECSRRRARRVCRGAVGAQRRTRERLGFRQSQADRSFHESDSGAAIELGHHELDVTERLCRREATVGGVRDAVDQ